MSGRGLGTIGAAAMVAALGIFLQAKAPSDKPGNGYERQMQSFHQERDADLKNNWATLAGLFWLRPGANSLGTDERKDAVVLPEGTIPARAGALELQGKQVTLRLAPAVKAAVGGKPFRSPLAMRPDVSGSPTKVEFAGGRVRMWVVQRGDRTGMRIQDMKRAEEYKPGVWYPTDPKWKMPAQWIPNTSGRKVIVPNVIGDATEIPVAGEARFTVNGQSLSMVALDDAPGTVEFVFADPTNKTETYHAGRFLDAQKPASGQPIVLDFNQAYNPPCSVTPYATCPLPPKENRLKVAIPAGQKFSGH